MITYISGCVSCGLPCRGIMCPNYKVPYMECDRCRSKDLDAIYRSESGQEICLECLKKEFLIKEIGK